MMLYRLFLTKNIDYSAPVFEYPPCNLYTMYWMTLLQNYEVIETGRDSPRVVIVQPSTRVVTTLQGYHHINNKNTTLTSNYAPRIEVIRKFGGFAP